MWNVEIATINGIICFLIAISPDLIGEYYAHIKKDNYNWYNSSHSGKINNIMKKYFVVPWIWHTYLDSYLHYTNNRWYAGIWYEYFMPWKWKEKMWVEILFWLINILFILFSIKYNF